MSITITRAMMQNPRKARSVVKPPGRIACAPAPPPVKLSMRKIDCSPTKPHANVTNAKYRPRTRRAISPRTTACSAPTTMAATIPM